MTTMALPPTSQDALFGMCSYEEVARALGCGRTKVYQLVKDGELPMIRVGKAPRIPATAVAAFIDRLLADRPA